MFTSRKHATRVVEGAALSIGAPGPYDCACDEFAETRRSAIEATQVVDGLITRIMDGIRRRPDDFSLYTIIESILSTGDRIADITVVPDGAQPDMLDVFADPRSVTAGIHPDWVSDHEQAIH